MHPGKTGTIDSEKRGNQVPAVAGSGVVSFVVSGDPPDDPGISASNSGTIALSFLRNTLIPIALVLVTRSSIVLWSIF
jgi:hypothetical protein